MTYTVEHLKYVLLIKDSDLKDFKSFLITHRVILQTLFNLIYYTVLSM